MGREMEERYENEGKTVIYSMMAGHWRTLGRTCLMDIFSTVYVHMERNILKGNTVSFYQRPLWETVFLHTNSCLYVVYYELCLKNDSRV